MSDQTREQPPSVTETPDLDLRVFHARTGVMALAASARYWCDRALKAEAALDAARQRQQWRDIETAPKETRVLAVLKPQPFEAVGEVTFVYWTQGVWTRDDTGEEELPILWLSVPDPPAALAQKEQP